MKTRTALPALVAACVASLAARPLPVATAATSPLPVPGGRAAVSLLAVSSPPSAVPGGRAAVSLLAVSSPPSAVPGGRAAVSLLAVSSPPSAVPGGRAAASGEFRFDQETLDVGRQAVGASFSVKFRFKNGGVEPILLANVQVGGGTVQFPKTPIKAGEVGEISVTLTAATAGKFTRVVTVTSNAITPQKYLYVRGDAF